MSIIEGIGDEVVHFIVGLVVILVCFLLWITTRVRNLDEPFFRTVYILERRSNNRNNSTARNETSLPDTDTVNRVVEVESMDTAVAETVPEHTTSQSLNDVRISNEDKVEPLNCIEKISFTSTSIPNVEKNPQNIIAKTYINVRLKFLNDDVKIVQGLLEEKLDDFKRRNFSNEINSNQVVRLIFNGRVLRDDNLSLKSHGLFDNCVMHCLILNERPRDSVYSNGSESTDHYRLNNEQTTPQEWNLSKLLCFLILGILSFSWYCRFQFASLFNFTSTSYLLGVTVIFLCSLTGTLYSDSTNTHPVNVNG